MNKARAWFDLFPEKPKASIRLLCFHHAGSNSFWCRKWTEILPEHWEVAGVVLPGHGKRNKEPFAEDIVTLAKQIAEDCQNFFNEKRFVVLGNSMGAVLAYEVIKILAPAGVHPLHFFPAACAGPQHFKGSDGFAWRFKSASEDDLVSYLKTIGGTPSDVLGSKNFLSRLLPLVRADGILMQEYRPNPTKISCPITYLRGLQDPSYTAEEQELWLKLSDDHRIRSFDAGHLFICSNTTEVLKQVVAIIGTPSREFVRSDPTEEAGNHLGKTLQSL